MVILCKQQKPAATGAPYLPGAPPPAYPSPYAPYATTAYPGASTYSMYPPTVPSPYPTSPYPPPPQAYPTQAYPPAPYPPQSYPPQYPPPPTEPYYPPGKIRNSSIICSNAKTYWNTSGIIDD